jgi:hypothetical protein
MRTPRRWLQFSLRGMALLVTTIAVIAAVRSYAEHKQRVFEFLEYEHGATVGFKHQIVEGSDTFETGPLAGGMAVYWVSGTGRGREMVNIPPNVPQWLRALLGDALFEDAVHVDFRADPVDNAVLAMTCRLRTVERLYLDNSCVTDDGLVHLRQLNRLEFLSLAGTRLTDNGLIHLKPLANLRCLDLSGTRITDAGLEQLSGLKKLEAVYVPRTRVTEEGASRLTRALPNGEAVLLPIWEAQ